MEMLLIKKDSPEWNRMWERLAQHPLNNGIDEPTVALNPENDEVWQYMGTFKQGNLAIHEFRHRSHPLDGDRKYYKFAASPEMNEDDIEKALGVK